MPFEFILPLLSGVIFVIAALFLKRASELGANVWQVTCICNFVTALVFIPVTFLGGKIDPLHLMWQPAIVGLLFLAGQILTFFALRIGDVSITTPVLGIKIVLVAFLTTMILGERVSLPNWISAGLASLSIALLNRSDAHSKGKTGLTILAAGGAAAVYALFDVLVQKWAPTWGAGRFLPVAMGIVGVGSLGLLPFAKSDRKTEGDPMRPLLAGAGCLGVQAILFISTIAVYGRATSANVLYSSRGLWSVLAVWLIGHWFKSKEQHLPRRILAWRVSGATLMLAAIILVLLTK